MSTDAPNSVEIKDQLAQERTGMAAYRTVLALDRTTLAWIRTTLGMASFGFGMVAFFRTLEERSPSPENLRLHQGAIRMGTALMLLGIGAMVLAGMSHWNSLRTLRRGETPHVSEWPISLTGAILTAIIGLGGLWAVFTR
jgi:putative membrane protein